MDTYILGVSAYYHDSAACLARDGKIVAAAQEERFTRKTFDARFPTHAIRYCLQDGGISLADLNPIIICLVLLGSLVVFTSGSGRRAFHLHALLDRKQ